MRRPPGPLEIGLRGLSWAADYVYALRWQARSLLRRRPAWLDVDAAATGVPVMLIPGIYESWRFLEPLGRRLAESGHPVHVAPLGLTSRPVGVLARAVSRAIVDAGLDDVVLVAHSKGGLIGKQVMLTEERRAARRPADDERAGDDEGTGDVRADAGARVRGMVAVNTPFGGSRYAGWVPLPAVRDLTPDALEALSGQRGVDRRITSVFARWDPHVPAGSRLEGADNVRLAERGHFRVLGLRRPQDAVLAAVARYVRR